MTHATCRLTAKDRDQLRNPTLGSRVYGLPRSRCPYLGGYSEVDLEPLGGGLGLGAPGEPVGPVEAAVSLVAAGVPAGRVDRRRAHLRVAHLAADQTQRTVPRTPYTAHSNATWTLAPPGEYGGSHVVRGSRHPSWTGRLFRE